mmetsp:Transcript_54887/g.95981  ORF Transcript_54887/g.95981 Transcript_54887/m.95981 type:complete len:256 (-) Transcript_54887:57-824(-)|eukprot:CAMPEP_0184988780 /NCGR_PEP_ID=MMETSP1098-20130426/25620_1 /TAXON_ID=89044 /ORGANISM="Spumella elongata, Strain CCAP 955/1" /LENGTH=255 /DNA_ID=CAMNT_0027513619 /DNA_START=258 /DNA_END=1028 /DNA_ORIENTATION=+
MLRSHNIITVLTIANGLILTLPDDINHIVIGIPDHPIADILSIVDATTSHIDLALSSPRSSNAGVLVHCASGISRSVSVCCAWLMLCRSMSFADSLEQIRTNRSLANPNVGFHAQLAMLSSVIQKNYGASDKELLAAAQLEYMKQLGGQTIMDALFEQRETANALHADVDALEVAIKQEANLNSLSVDQIKQWENALIAIINRGKDAEPNGNSDNNDQDDALSKNRIQSIQDKVATMVRRAAVSKAVRLLDDLDN